MGPRQRQDLQAFLSNFGGTTNELTLIWSNSYQLSVSDLNRLVFEQTPALETLKLGSGEGRSGSLGSDTTMTAPHDKLEMTLKLKSLQVQAHYSELDLVYVRFLRDVVASACSWST